MALVACPECKKEISDTVKACPFCGHKSSWTFGKVVGLITLIFIIGKCSTESSKISTQKPAEKTPQQLESDVKFYRNVGMLKNFKQTLHNPSSFQIESVFRTDEDTLCVQYRATNKLNALILSQVVILTSRDIGKWNVHCVGKSGVDITYIKRAL